MTMKASYFRRIWGKLQVQYKFQALTQIALIGILVPAQVWMTHHYEELVMKSAKERADAIADDVVNGLNALMIAKIGKENVISDKKAREIYLGQMAVSSGMQDLRIIRGAGIDKEFDEGLPQERAVDELDKQVLSNGLPAYRQIVGSDGGLALRSVLPYVARENQRGVNCLKCHDVAEGEVIGATSIVISLKEDMATIKRIDRMLWIGQLLVQILIFILVRFIAKRAVAGPLAGLRDSIIGIGRDKDFTRRVAVSGEDEIGHTGVAFNGMVEEVQDTLRGIQSSMLALRRASGDVTTVAQRVVLDAVKKKDSSEAMASSVEELYVSMQEVANSANAVSRETNRSGELSEEGAKILDQAVAEMNGIASAVSEASGVITSLGEQSQQITTVVKVINEIAEQTNLLALNAAIEAARAGESGRGFAVVADEVKKLAERTARSTTEIHGLVSAIQEQVESAVVEIRSVIDKVRDGQVSISKVGGNIVDIREQCGKVANLVGDISRAIGEENTFCKTIADNVEEVARMSEDGHLTANSLFSDAEKLSSIARDVAKAVAAFKVK